MFRIPYLDPQPAVVVSIMSQSCYKLGLPFLALPLYYDTRRRSTIGEHLVTGSVTELDSISTAPSWSLLLFLFLLLFPLLCELCYGIFIVINFFFCT